MTGLGHHTDQKNLATRPVEGYAEMMPLKTVVIDANRLSREGLLAILSRNGISVVAEVGRTEDLLTNGPAASRPDLVLVDCSSDPEAARTDLHRLRAAYPESRIVVLSGHTDLAFLTACFEAPIDGFVSRSVSSTALLKSLDLVMTGERVFPANLLISLMTRRVAVSPALPAAANPGSGLSEREIQILQRLVAGESNKVIANTLNVTEATVKVHLKSILRKIRVRNRTQAAIWALNRGMGLDRGASDGVNASHAKGGSGE